jgi:hypothetical protein
VAAADTSAAAAEDEPSLRRRLAAAQQVFLRLDELGAMLARPPGGDHDPGRAALVRLGEVLHQLATDGLAATGGGPATVADALGRCGDETWAERTRSFITTGTPRPPSPPARTQDGDHPDPPGPPDSDDIEQLQARQMLAFALVIHVLQLLPLLGRPTVHDLDHAGAAALERLRQVLRELIDDGHGALRGPPDQIDDVAGRTATPVWSQHTRAFLSAATPRPPWMLRPGTEKR